MISVTIKHESRKVLLGIPKHRMLHQDGVEKGLRFIGQQVIRHTQNLITRVPKTGRIYAFRGRDHQASAPSEPPANRSGRLARSGKYLVSSWSRMEVGETAPYAGYLEDGTKRMAARPHLQRSVNATARDAVKAFEDNGKRNMGLR